MSRALLWKAEFARMVTSSTRQYIQEYTDLCWFIAVPYYGMVCTAMELCCHYHNWVHTISCHVLKIKVKSLNSMYWDKPVTYQYVLRQTWYIQLQIPEQYVLRQTTYILVCTRFAWYVLRQTWYILVHASMYAKKRKMKIVRGVQIRTEDLIHSILHALPLCH